MRTVDLSGGSLKALLILLLVVANILASLPRENTRPRAGATPESAQLQRHLAEKHPH